MRWLRRFWKKSNSIDNMPAINPEFACYLYNTENPVTEDKESWTNPLPVNRLSERPKQDNITHGDYFSAIKDFLTKDNYKNLFQTISSDSQYKTSDEIKFIRIILEKHGEFYHPARIDALLSSFSFSFVINLAVSGHGKNCIEQEYELLNSLAEKFPFSFVPQVYALGKGLALNGQQFPMFTGEWFEGYFEFHISAKENKIQVWDAEPGNTFLSSEQSLNLYRQAAMILTCYYDLETFAQIFPWHHGAGDFVVRVSEKGIELKLITVRQYEPLILIDEDEKDERIVLEALLIFFLHLSIRMRIDRLDGVDELAWADDIAVKGTIDGFFQGLSLLLIDSVFPENLTDIFLKYLMAVSEEDLLGTAETIYHTYPFHAPELDFIRQNLKSHINVLVNIINTSLNM